MPCEPLAIDADLTVETFQRLRAETDWGVPDAHACRRAIDNSLLVLTARADGRPVAMLRIVGDGVLNAYLQDLIVHSDYRGRGIGRQMVGAAVSELAATCPPTLTLGLMSARGMDGFYEALGFRARPNASEGAGFQASLGELLRDRECRALAKPGPAD